MWREAKGVSGPHVDVGVTEECSFVYRIFVMRYSYRLNVKEREYMLILIGEAVESVKVRNTKMCTEHVKNAIRNVGRGWGGGGAGEMIGQGC